MCCVLSLSKVTLETYIKRGPPRWTFPKEKELQKHRAEKLLEKCPESAGESGTPIVMHVCSAPTWAAGGAPA